jgi:SAM-dependent methyltransferase
MNPEAYQEMAHTETHHWWFMGRRYIIQSIIKSLKLPSEANILEVGCGTGGNLFMLSKFGFVDAIEMDSGAIKFAKKSAGGLATITQGKCPNDLKGINKKYDLICLFDVLEHIEEDLDTLKRLKELLTDSGEIVITVPAYQWLWSIHDEKLHHKRRYTRKQLDNLSVSAGLIPIRTTHFNTLLFPLAALTRLLSSVCPVNAPTGSNTPPKIINTLFKYIFQSEKYLINTIQLPFGVSILTRLHRKSH